MDKNGYFQIEKKADGLYVHVIPAVGKGKKPVMEEFIAYLDKKKVPYNNPVELRKAFELALVQGKPSKFSNAEIPILSPI